MVALPAQDSLPTLTDRESSLLAAYLTVRFDLAALAESQKLKPEELLAFARSPAVKAHVAELRTFAEDSFALRSLQSRSAAIDTLEAVSKAAENPVERRRAASAILRGMAPLPSPRAERSSSLRSTRAPIQDIAGAAPPAPPAPTVRPSPNFTHRDAAETVAAALKAPSPESFATLHAFSAPDATLGQAKAPPELSEFVEVAQTVCPKIKHESTTVGQRALDQKASTETRIAYFLTFRPHSHTNQNEIGYELTVELDAANRWLLKSLKRWIPPANTG